MIPNDDNSELLLEASRYLSGEMSAVEAEGFEERLAVNQAVRETLADLVLIEKCILADRGSARRMPVSSCRNALYNDHFRMPAALAGLASLVAVVAMAVSLRLGNPESVQVSQHSPMSDADLSAVSLWASLAADIEAPAEKSDDLALLLDMEAIEIPDWMFAAVEAGAAVKEHSDLRDPLDDEENL